MRWSSQPIICVLASLALLPSAAAQLNRYANRLTLFDMRHVMRYT